MAKPSKFTQVTKRDGRRVPFDARRIEEAVRRAMEASGEGDVRIRPARLRAAVVSELERRLPERRVPSVEEIQDVVEEALILHDLPRTAKAYILYRHERARVRERARAVPEPLRALAAASKAYFRTPLCEFIYYRTYSRWLEEEGRRETWVETVDRYTAFMAENLGERLSGEEYGAVRDAILRHRVMPSMRLLWSAGTAARVNNAAAYNCAYVALNRLEDFGEIMFLLMSGVGVGFSVETRNVQLLPIVRPQSGGKPAVHRVGDSKEGWGDALKTGLAAWYAGEDLVFDYAGVRPAGARLRTMGGRSSGPRPLKALLEYVRAKVLSCQGRRLRNIDVHDVVCKIGELVEMGGVRRAALISLSDFDDLEMRGAKAGPFFLTEPQRALANNSAVYDAKPLATDFLEEWLVLARSGTGERGLFNRGALPTLLPERRREGFDPYLSTSGVNPCGEIVLRSRQFCNLTEVVARPEDDEASLLAKLEVAALIGTYQSTLTHFPYLGPEWRRNSEEERLLGVSLTGQWDCAAARDGAVLARLKTRAVEANRRYAERFGIAPSAAVTCVKPSGTVSQLVDSASGMHPRFARYYLRRIRISASDPLLSLLRDQKFPCQPEVGQLESSASTFVLEFPVRAPEGAITQEDLSALDQLEHWRLVRERYTEHNPSVTISVGPDEWIATADWLYRHWDLLGGLSFLPRRESVYQLAPYEEITEEEYRRRLAELPHVDFSRILLYEREDSGQGAKEYACTGGACELDPEEGQFAGAALVRWR